MICPNCRTDTLLPNQNVEPHLFQSEQYICKFVCTKCGSTFWLGNNYT